MESCPVLKSQLLVGSNRCLSFSMLASTMPSLFAEYLCQIDSEVIS